MLARDSTFISLVFRRAEFVFKPAAMTPEVNPSLAVLETDGFDVSLKYSSFSWSYLVWVEGEPVRFGPTHHSSFFFFFFFFFFYNYMFP